ncbi:MAG: HD domain-containing protein [Ornithinimicrobium sp.]|uniref:HD domain-containing protein n=1 Tax=Ornithinimicrobium sp. TaxID=1977084 RepID=UPI003D9BE7F7
MAEPARSLTERWGVDLAVLTPEAGPDLWGAELDLLVAGWSTPHRRYHTLEHLSEMVRALDDLVTAGDLSVDDARIARLAAWYHDLAYDPRAAAGSNEHRSATLARDHLHRLGVDDDVVDAVEALVLMTVEHDADIEASPARQGVLDAFHDADLWILSAPRARYEQYAEQVRQEYAHVPDTAFAHARAAILRSLMQRPWLYRCPHAIGSWEARARANVSRELAALAMLSSAQVSE